jgi:hypothetical protein
MKNGIPVYDPTGDVGTRRHVTERRRTLQGPLDPHRRSAEKNMVSHVQVRAVDFAWSRREKGCVCESIQLLLLLGRFEVYRIFGAMVHQLRHLTCLFLAVMLVLQPLIPQSSDTVRLRVHELHSNRSEVRVFFTDGTSVRGRIIRIEPDSFTLRRNSAQEAVFPFAKVADIRKHGSGPRKALWIPIAIGGGVLLALCAAPYPIGFLCRSDPS